MTRRKPPSIARQIKERLAHSGLLALVLWVAGTVTVLCVAIINFEPAYSKVEPIIPASAGYVREHVREKLTPFEEKQLAQSTSVERLIQFQLEEYLARTRKDPAFRSSPVVQERARELEKQIDDTRKRVIEAESVRNQPRK